MIRRNLNLIQIMWGLSKIMRKQSTEQFHRRKGLPTSSQAIKNNVIKDTINFTPQESEQLSKYVSDDEFVQTQKKILNHLQAYTKDL